MMISKEKLLKAIKNLIDDEMVNEEDLEYIKMLMSNYSYSELYAYFKFDLIDSDIYINNKEVA